MSDCFIVLSGCSGRGKSSLLDELRRRGYSVVDEPGRRIVQAELESGGRALPWLDLAAFARRAVELALSDLNAAAALPGWVFFDRGLVDAAAALNMRQERLRCQSSLIVITRWSFLLRRGQKSSLLS